MGPSTNYRCTGARLDAAIDFTLHLQHIVVYDIMMQIFLQRFVVICAAFGRFLCSVWSFVWSDHTLQFGATATQVATKC